MEHKLSEILAALGTEDDCRFMLAVEAELLGYYLPGNPSQPFQHNNPPTRITFPSMTSHHRFLLHTVCERLGLKSSSLGFGHDKPVVVCIPGREGEGQSSSSFCSLPVLGLQHFLPAHCPWIQLCHTTGSQSEDVVLVTPSSFTPPLLPPTHVVPMEQHATSAEVPVCLLGAETHPAHQQVDTIHHVGSHPQSCSTAEGDHNQSAGSHGESDGVDPVSGGVELRAGEDDSAGAGHADSVRSTLREDRKRGPPMRVYQPPQRRVHLATSQTSPVCDTPANSAPSLEHNLQSSDVASSGHASSLPAQECRRSSLVPVPSAPHISSHQDEKCSTRRQRGRGTTRYQCGGGLLSDQPESQEERQQETGREEGEEERKEEEESAVPRGDFREFEAEVQRARAEERERQYGRTKRYAECESGAWMYSRSWQLAAPSSGAVVFTPPDTLQLPSTSTLPAALTLCLLPSHTAHSPTCHSSPPASSHYQVHLDWGADLLTVERRRGSTPPAGKGEGGVVWRVSHQLSTAMLTSSQDTAHLFALTKDMVIPDGVSRASSWWVAVRGAIVAVGRGQVVGGNVVALVRDLLPSRPQVQRFGLMCRRSSQGNNQGNQITIKAIHFTPPLTNHATHSGHILLLHNWQTVVYKDDDLKLPRKTLSDNQSCALAEAEIQKWVKCFNIPFSDEIHIVLISDVLSWVCFPSVIEASALLKTHSMLSGSSCQLSRFTNFQMMSKDALRSAGFIDYGERPTQSSRTVKRLMKNALN